MKIRSRGAGILTVLIVSGVALYASHVHLVREHQELVRQHERLMRERYGFSENEHPVVPAKQAIEILKAGNRRYVNDMAADPAALAPPGLQTQSRTAERPFAVIIGCSDSRCPVESVFDSKPGDLYVLRNAGNSCTDPEGSLVASVEYALNNFDSKLVLVLGHTGCAAMARATMNALRRLGGEAPSSGRPTALEEYLEDLEDAVEEAVNHLPEGSPEEAIALLATKVNVFNTIERLVRYSARVRELAKIGDIELHGAMYDVATGQVDFFGQHPRLQEVLTQPGFS